MKDFLLPVLSGALAAMIMAWIEPALFANIGAESYPAPAPLVVFAVVTLLVAGLFAEDKSIGDLGIIIFALSFGVAPLLAGGQLVPVLGNLVAYGVVTVVLGVIAFFAIAIALTLLAKLVGEEESSAFLPA